MADDTDEARRAREARLAIAASRAVFVALTVPALPLSDAAKRFGYRPRTPEGDAFEHAFDWAHEEAERHEIAKAPTKNCICPIGLDAVACKKHRYGQHASVACECICHVEERQDERDEEDASHG